MDRFTIADLMAKDGDGRTADLGGEQIADDALRLVLALHRGRDDLADAGVQATGSIK